MIDIENLEKLARQLETMEREQVLAILSVVAGDLHERGELVACATFIGLAARETGDERAYHKLVHEFDQENRTQEKFRQMVEHAMGSQPPSPDDISLN